MMESVASYFELYLSRQPLRPASLDIKRRACRIFCEEFGRPSPDPGGLVRMDLPVSEVTSAMAEEYRTFLAVGRQQVSVNGYLNNFKPFWAWLTRHGYVRTNPFVTIRSVPVDEQAPRRTFSTAELAQLMQIASPFWRIRICLGLMGARRGEMLLGVQARDVKLDADTPHIVIGYHRPDTKTIGWGVKGKKLRYLGLPEHMVFDGTVVPLREHLRDRIAELAHEDGYVCLESHYVEKLLELQAAGRLSFADMRDPTKNFPRKFRRLQERAGIRETRRFHELRAAFATSMIEKFGLSRAADLLGHSSVETTRKYDRKTQLSLVAEATEVASGAYVTKVS
ncbi:MAG: tyrosine-type recombinase/integrase [Phycisphaerales bacterium]